MYVCVCVIARENLFRGEAEKNGGIAETLRVQAKYGRIRLNIHRKMHALTPYLIEIPIVVVLLL